MLMQFPLRYFRKQCHVRQLNLSSQTHNTILWLVSEHKLSGCTRFMVSKDCNLIEPMLPKRGKRKTTQRKESRLEKKAGSASHNKDRDHGLDQWREAGWLSEHTLKGGKDTVGKLRGFSA